MYLNLDIPIEKLAFLDYIIVMSAGVKKWLQIIVAVIVILVFVLSYTIYSLPFSSQPQPEQPAFDGPTENPPAEAAAVRVIDYKAPTGLPSTKGPSGPPPTE